MVFPIEITFQGKEYRVWAWSTDVWNDETQAWENVNPPVELLAILPNDP